MVYLHGVGHDAGEPFHIVGAPCLVYLAVFAEVGLHKVERRIDAHEGVGQRAQGELDSSGDVALRGFQICLHLAHYRLQILALVEEHAVPIADLVLPVLLPLGEGVLFEHLVRRDDEYRAGSLEAHAALDADYGVADVHVAAYAVASADGFDLAYGFDGIVEVLAVYGLELAFLESEG